MSVYVCGCMPVEGGRHCQRAARGHLQPGPGPVGTHNRHPDGAPTAAVAGGDEASKKCQCQCRNRTDTEGRKVGERCVCVRRFVCQTVCVSCGGGVMWWGCHGFVCVARATVWVISICLPGGPSHEGHGVVVRQTRPQHITVTVTVRIVVVAMVWKALTGR